MFASSAATFPLKIFWLSVDISSVTNSIRACIDLGAVRNNYALLRSLARGAQVMAVIKSNGYGHGMVHVATALPSADAFGVARLAEALELRRAGVRNRIVLLEGVSSAAGMAQAGGANIEVVLHCTEHLGFLSQAGRQQPQSVWLKIDTGMNRLGFRPEELPEVALALRAICPPSSRFHALTHLACADDLADPATPRQVAVFNQCLAGVVPILGQIPQSICNSAGLLGWPQIGGDWMRTGLALYGISPFPSGDGSALGLTTAMSLKTSVICVKDVLPGEHVGYGARWIASRPSRIAVLSGGYADGVLRGIPSGTPVFVKEQSAPIIGRISMGMLAIDVTEIEGVEIGAEVELWGKHISVSHVAQRAGTIAYELLCGMSHQVPHEFTSSVGTQSHSELHVPREA